MLFSSLSLMTLGMVTAVRGTNPTMGSSFSESSVGAKPTAGSSSSTESFTFNSSFEVVNVILGTRANFSWKLEAEAQQLAGDLVLVLCQTNATGADSVTPENTWSIVQLPYCPDGIQPCTFNFLSPERQYSSYKFELLPGSNLSLSSGYFLCFGTGSNSELRNLVCDSYSDFFLVDQKAPVKARQATTESAPPPVATTRPPPSIGPSEPLSLTDSKPFMSWVGMPTAAASARPTTTVTSIGSTASVALSTTVIPTASATLVSTSASGSSSGGGLSIGAKVGIALGALAFALILLILALLFLRRKHAKRNQPEQVMLTHSMHQDSFSRNLITEKENHVSNSEAATPIDEPALPIQRHSALSPYDPVPSAPYTGAAAAVPRRKPTAATMASTVSRGLSTTSGTSSSGLQSPRSGNGFEEYHDVPVYGDARHVPQVFPGNSSSSQAPFLHSEEGMTPEEVARLEEEERRIDAAIAEAERR